MDLAAEMRNRDITLELIGEEAGSAASTFIENLKEERNQAKKELTAELIRWRRRDFSRKWRPWLAR